MPPSGSVWEATSHCVCGISTLDMSVCDDMTLMKISTLDLFLSAGHVCVLSTQDFVSVAAG